MYTNLPSRRSPVIYFLLLFALSSPFWIFGAVMGEQLLPGLPVSAVVLVFCPLLTALILVYRENRTKGMIELLKRAFDYKRIRAKIWYIPIVLLMPAVMIVEFGLLRLTGVPVPDPQFSIPTALGLFLGLFIAALGEELGWTGYAIDPLQDRSNALQASIVLGLVWAAWHLVALVQVGRAADWIAWWSLYTVAQRVIIVWLYNNTGKSVFAVTVYHAMMNLCWQLFPIDGSFWDPRITALIVSGVAVIVTLVWRPKTLAHFRYARASQE
jgi:membrane protease YdiL (CAAX protease family)